MNRIPEQIKKYIDGKNYMTDETGMSGSQVLLFPDMVLKIQEHSIETEREYHICKWLKQRIPVPEILEYAIAEGKSYCLMTRIPGRMICDDMYMANPEQLLEIVSQAMKLLWSIDINSCPCDNSLHVKLKQARYNIENGLVDLDNVDSETFGENGFHSPEELMKWLEENRPEEELVFSHGDFSMPNIFAAGDKISGFIDLGRMGIADRWQDIAICYRSLKHNFEGRYNGGFPYEGYRPEMLFEKLEIEPDYEKLKYYILLDELF